MFLGTISVVKRNTSTRTRALFFGLLATHNIAVAAPGDADDDGIPDFWEEQYQLDPFDPSDASMDFDGDDLTNIEEFQHNVDPLNPDTDTDMLWDGMEVEIGTDPLLVDSDQDQLPDGWEYGYGLDPVDPLDAGDDLDFDGLTNLEEFQVSTDPSNEDSDGDTLLDGNEVANGTLPADADTDNDGLSDAESITFGSDPLLWDSNSNLIADGFEFGSIIKATAKDWPLATYDHASSGSAISKDGRYIAFVSASDELVPDDNNGEIDVFWMDMVTGERRLVSRAIEGGSGNSWSGRFVNSIGLDISADGQRVVYQSKASNIIQNDENGSIADIFLYSAQTDSNTLISLNSDDIQANNSCWNPKISADGRFVVFRSNASVFLTEPDTNSYSSDVFLRDLELGTTTLISKNANGEQGNHQSEKANISADGNIITFMSRASNLVLNDPNDSYFGDLFMHNRATNVTTMINVLADGQAYYVNSFDTSANGNLIALSTTAALDLSDENGAMDCYIYNVESNSSSIISNITSQYDMCVTPVLSDSGRFVAYEKLRGSFNVGDGIYIVDLQTEQTTIATKNETGSDSVSYGREAGLALSGDGQFVQFAVNTTLLTPGQSRGPDIFVSTTQMPIEETACGETPLTDAVFDNLSVE